VYIFRFANSSDSVVIQNGSTQEVVVPQQPHVKGINFGNYSDPFLLVGGWSYVTSPPVGMSVKRPTCPVFAGPNCP
jgi:hypothetical protein